MKSILIADDHPLTVRAVKDILKSVFQKVKINTIKNWSELASNLRGCIDLYILDLEMPGGEAVYWIEELNKRCPLSKIIILTSHCQPWIFNGLAKCKIDGFVSKLSEPSELIEAIRLLKDDEQFLCGEFRRIYQKSKESLMPIDHLTPREIEILTLILDAKSTKEIALELNISVNTVETHRKNLFLKFEVNNVVGLVNKATLLGNYQRAL